jgi:hypothetical protein
MARFFGGMGGKGAGSRFGGGKDGKSVDSLAMMRESLAAKKKGSSGLKASELSAEERYQKLMNDKMEAHKQRLMQQKKYSHNLPGTAPADKELSKSTQLALETIAAKMAKRELRKKQPPKKMEIRPMTIGGSYTGYIDAKGNIWNSYQKKVLKIDLKTGDIRSTGFFGKKIGKFDPKSYSSIYTIEKFLAKDALKDGRGVNNIWGQQAGEKPKSDPSSIYGTSSWNNDGGNNGWW